MGKVRRGFDILKGVTDSSHLTMLVEGHETFHRITYEEGNKYSQRVLARCVLGYRRLWCEHREHTQSRREHCECVAWMKEGLEDADRSHVWQQGCGKCCEGIVS